MSEFVNVEIVLLGDHTVTFGFRELTTLIASPSGRGENGAEGICRDGGRRVEGHGD